MSNKVILTVKLNNNRLSIQNIKLPSSSPSPLINYYTKEETDSLLGNKLDTTKLNNSINKALKEAKDSGLFDGKDGLPGPQGPIGPQGILGEQGIPGMDGKDGKDGEKPVKGEDYFTEKEKQEFIKDITEDITQTIKDKVEEIIGDVDLDGNASSIEYDSSMAVTHDVYNVKDALDKLLNKVYYVALSLSSSSGGGTYEKGSTQNITITAEFNKVPDSITINNKDVITPSLTIEKTYNNVTINQTYEFIAYSTNAEGDTIDVSKKFYVTFVNKKYYGVSSKETLTSSEINDLTGVLDGDRKGDFTVNAGDDQYIFFAIPSAYGTPTFNVGGFEGGIDKVQTISHTNKSGHTENYDVYKSAKVGLGNTKVTVN